VQIDINIKESQTYFVLDVVEDNLRQLYDKRGLLKALNSFSAQLPPAEPTTTSNSQIMPAQDASTEQVWTKFQANVFLDKISMKVMSRDARGMRLS
jgi:hypothetical protein